MEENIKICEYSGLRPMEGYEQESKTFWENPALYSKIEHAIIEWSNDNTKTAGELTRQILKLVK